tara:strand:+ start:220 stop:531 length:312 start_codon:yes stop_codon:yes gene_type:complete
MSKHIKQLGSNRTLLLLGNVEILYSYSTPVAARLADGSFISSKNYYQNGTTKTSQKHITQTLNYWSLEYGLTRKQSQNDATLLGPGTKLVDQQEIEDLIPLHL